MVARPLDPSARLGARVASAGRAIRLLAALLPDAAYVPLAMLAAWSLVALPGVPYCHDGMGVERIESYRRTYLVGDFFPTWTPLAANGHGSPHLLLYHRLHAQLFGLLSLAIGTVPSSKTAVIVLLAFGGAGMRRLCAMHGVRPWLSWLTGVLLLASNYVLVDWYVRGAIAEETAFMLVPWCITALIDVVDRNKSPVRLGIWSSLLFYGHMVVSMFFGFIVLSVLVERLSRARALGWEAVRRLGRQMLLTGAVGACCVLPYAAAVAFATPICNIGDFGMEDHKTYPFPNYLFDPNLSWFGEIHQDQITVEIGRYFVLPLFALLVLSPAARRAVRGRVWRLFVPALCFLLVQPHDCIFLFNLVPGLAKVQFAWRLISYIVPIVILALAVGTEWTLRAAAPFWSQVAAGAALLVVAGQMATTVRSQRDAKTKWRTDEDIVKSRYLSDVEVTATWQGFNPGGGVRIPRTSFIVASPDCTFSSPELTGGKSVAERVKDEDFLLLHISVHGTGCRLKINQYNSPLLVLGASQPVQLRTDSDGLMILDMPHDGTTLTIRKRGIFELAGLFLEQHIVAIGPQK